MHMYQSGLYQRSRTSILEKEDRERGQESDGAEKEKRGRCPGRKGREKREKDLLQGISLRDCAWLDNSE